MLSSATFCGPSDGPVTHHHTHDCQQVTITGFDTSKVRIGNYTGGALTPSFPVEACYLQLCFISFRWKGRDCSKPRDIKRSWIFLSTHLPGRRRRLHCDTLARGFVHQDRVSNVCFREQVYSTFTMMQKQWTLLTKVWFNFRVKP